MAEDKKINLFYLKDIIMKDSSSLLEKIDAVNKIKKNSTLPVFKFAIEPLLHEFFTLPDLVVQVELVNAIGKSQHIELLKSL